MSLLHLWDPRIPKQKVMPSVLHCTDRAKKDQLYGMIWCRVHRKKYNRVLTEEQLKRKRANDKEYRKRVAQKRVIQNRLWRSLNRERYNANNRALRARKKNAQLQVGV